jgi:LSD1 subclass zinc finger protein
MRPVEELVLDGNAVAGALSQVFVGDPTTVRVTCGGCREVRMLATARLYRGAAEVLRCSGCDAVLLTVVTAPDRVYLELTGIQWLELVSV